LQATRLALAVDRIVVKMDLTPGVDVAPLIFALINTNRDGRISETEARTYANQVLKETVLEVAGKRQHLDMVTSHFPSSQDVSTWTANTQLKSRAARAGTLRQHSKFPQTHQSPDLGRYLLNALVPANQEL